MSRALEVTDTADPDASARWTLALMKLYLEQMSETVAQMHSREKPFTAFEAERIRRRSTTLETLAGHLANR